jgi:hypothetical protein
MKAAKEVELALRAEDDDRELRGTVERRMRRKPGTTWHATSWTPRNGRSLPSTTAKTSEHAKLRAILERVLAFTMRPATLRCTKSCLTSFVLVKTGVRTAASDLQSVPAAVAVAV